MKLRYILGRAGTGKTRRIFEEIKYRLDQGGKNKLILLVPEQFTLQTETDLIKSIEVEGIIRTEVLSFKLLAHKVFTEVGGLKRIDINELGKIMVLRRIFDTYSKELNIYQKASDKRGFLENFCKLISEFKGNDISPEILQESIISIEDDIILKKKLEDITFIYEKFNQYMEGKYTDEEDMINMLIEKIEEARFLDDAEIWIDGFAGFSQQEYRVLEKLMLKAKKVNISLTYSTEEKVRDKELFEPTKETFNKIREIATRHGIKEVKTTMPTDDIVDKIKKPHDLMHIEREIYSYPYNRYKHGPENIHMFSGTNQYSEIENVACKIISLVRDRSYRWNDIAIVNGSMDIYTPIIKRVFSEYGIPYFIDEKRSILNNPIIKLTLSALDILYKNFRYEDVFRFIKTGFCKLDREEGELLENYVLQFGIEGNKWLEDFRYETEDGELEKINEIRRKFITPFINLKEKLKTKSTISDLSTYMFEFLTELQIEDKLNKWIEKLRREGRIEYVNENTQIWNILMEVFDQLVEILGDTKVSIKEYRKTLEAGFSQYEVGIIPPTIDQVLVGNLERSRSHEIKALFVVGVNDGILPSILDDDGLLLDDEKLIIKDTGVPIYSHSETKIKEEQFSIYTSLSKPREYLWISYALADTEGRALRPSILIDRIKKIYPELKVHSDISKGLEIKAREEKELNLVATPVSTFKYLIENLRLKIDGNLTTDLWDEVYNWYYKNEDWDYKRRLMIDGLFFDNQEDYIGDKKARQLYDVPLRSSISRLETFVNCPFSHFINYGLRPQERKEYKVGIPDIGMLFHDSMEKFAEKLTLENLDWKELGREKCDEIVENIIDEIAPEFQNNVLLSSHRYKYLINKLKRVSKRAAWTLTTHVKQGKFEPSLYEFAFGEGSQSEAPPIIIELPDGDIIKLEGRIDRVDLLKDGEKTYVKVIDYKSGSKKFSLSDVYYGLQIQLIVYLDAILENKDKLKIDDAHPGGVFYFRLDDPMVESDNKNPESIEQEIMKKLKMDGIILKDIKVVKAIDNEIEEKKKSDIIPVSLKKDGDFGAYSSVLEEKEFMGIIKHVKNLIEEIAKEILKGNIKIQPFKKDKNIACEYCKYATICQFDKNFDNNTYRNIKNLRDDEVIRKIKGEGGEEDA